MKITYKSNNAYGTYLCFGEFEYEEDFPRFLSNVCEKLGIPEPVPTQYPYSIIAEFFWLESQLIAMFDGYAGCCIVVPNDSSDVVKKLEDLFNGKQS